MAQLGSSIIHPHVQASCTSLCSHLCIARLAWLPPAPGLALSQAGGLDPHGAWYGAGNVGGHWKTRTFCGAQTNWLGCCGVGSRLPAFPSPSLLCPQHVSLAPQAGPVVMAKRRRSSVAPLNAVSRDATVIWAGLGYIGCPSARKQCCNLQSCRSAGAQLSSLGACAFHCGPSGDSIPGCAGLWGWEAGGAELMGRHWSTVGCIWARSH